MTSAIEARRAQTLRALLQPPLPLLYREGTPRAELPAHLRAGSAVRRWGERLVVVQDDVHALGLLDERTGSVAPLLLPPGADGRRVFGDDTGNKAHKMDLEACVTLPDGRLIALGSGSTDARERVVIVAVDGAVRVVDARALFAALRDRPDFSGSELNIEGAVVRAETLLLFQRGNGAPRAGLAPVNAIGELDLAAFIAFLDGGAVPTLTRVTTVNLGRADTADVAFGFTDACALPDGRVAFLAGAEDSPDTYRDGQVVGCRFGLFDGASLTYTDVMAPEGEASRLKLEGLDWVGEGPDGAWEFVVVADMDSAHSPALLAHLLVHGADVPPPVTERNPS